MRFQRRGIVEHYKRLDVLWFWHRGWLEPDTFAITYPPRGEAPQVIPIDWTPCNFGGQRPWFICWCGRRAALLYLVGKYFQCRKCLGLIHASVNESKQDRAHRKMLKIRKRLGYGNNLMEPILFKPKGMHYRTFRRLLDEYEVAEEIYWQPLVNAYLRMVQKMGINLAEMNCS